MISDDPLYSIDWSLGLPDFRPPFVSIEDDFDWYNDTDSFFPNRLAISFDAGVGIAVSCNIDFWADHQFQALGTFPPTGRWVPAAGLVFQTRWNVYGFTLENGSQSFVKSWQFPREGVPGITIVAGALVLGLLPNGSTTSPPNTITTDDFTLPAINGSVVVGCEDTAGMVVGDQVRLFANTTFANISITFTIVSINGLDVTLQYTPVESVEGAIQGNLPLFPIDVVMGSDACFLVGGLTFSQTTAPTSPLSLALVEKMTLGGERIWIKEISKPGSPKNGLVYSVAFGGDVE